VTLGPLALSVIWGDPLGRMVAQGPTVRDRGAMSAAVRNALAVYRSRGFSLGTQVSLMIRYLGPATSRTSSITQPAFLDGRLVGFAGR
jgi:hypothetical protein